MVFFVVRGAALFGIAGLTGLMWFQDHTKKVMVIKNTTQELFSNQEPTRVQVEEKGPLQITTTTEPKKGYIQKTTEIYNKAADSKSEKLADKHLTFGIMALVGSLIMPKMSLLLALLYFLAYQIYYFSVDTRRFLPIWKGFMAGGGVMYAYKVLSKTRIF